MIGKPKFKLGDKVKFTLEDKEHYGFIYIVDKYGVFEDNTEVHYDVMVEEENCLYKHLREDIVKKIRKTRND